MFSLSQSSSPFLFLSISCSISLHHSLSFSLYCVTLLYSQSEVASLAKKGVTVFIRLSLLCYIPSPRWLPLPRKVSQSLSVSLYCVIFPVRGGFPCQERCHILYPSLSTVLPCSIPSPRWLPLPRKVSQSLSVSLYCVTVLYSLSEVASLAKKGVTVFIRLSLLCYSVIFPVRGGFPCQERCHSLYPSLSTVLPCSIPSPRWLPLPRKVSQSLSVSLYCVTLIYSQSEVASLAKKGVTFFIRLSLLCYPVIFPVRGGFPCQERCHSLRHRSRRLCGRGRTGDHRVLTKSRIAR